MSPINLWMKTITKICVSEMEGTAQKALMGRYGLGKHKGRRLPPEESGLLHRSDERAASDGGALRGRRRLVVVRLHRREQQHLLGKHIYKGEKAHSPPQQPGKQEIHKKRGGNSGCSASLIPLVWYAGVKPKRPH